MRPLQFYHERDAGGGGRAHHIWHRLHERLANKLKHRLSFFVVVSLHSKIRNSYVTFAYFTSGDVVGCGIAAADMQQTCCRRIFFADDSAGSLTREAMMM